MEQKNGREVTRYKVTIQGISPLLMNPMSLEQLMDIHNKVRKPQKTDVDLKEVAAGKLYKDDEGRVGIPMQNLFSVLVEAGRHVTYSGKSKWSTKESSLVPTVITFGEEFFPFTNDAAWTPDLRRGINPGSVGAKVPVAVIRPKFKEWVFDCTITVDHKKISLETLKELFEWGGNAVGLCDFRPTCRGPFGRFRAVKWEQLPMNGN